jgi:hypothetical protein
MIDLPDTGLSSLSHVDVMYAASCVHGYEPSGSIKQIRFLDQLSYC